jgi:hypothetical protein
MEWVSRPLAWSFVPAIDDEFWGPRFEYLAFGRLFEIEASGLTHVVCGNDWRRLPVEAWLDLMNEREHSGGTGPPTRRSCSSAPTAGCVSASWPGCGGAASTWTPAAST